MNVCQFILQRPPTSSNWLSKNSVSHGITLNFHSRNWPLIDQGWYYSIITLITSYVDGVLYMLLNFPLLMCHIHNNHSKHSHGTLDEHIKLIFIKYMLDLQKLTSCISLNEVLLSFLVSSLCTKSQSRLAHILVLIKPECYFHRQVLSADKKRRSSKPSFRSSVSH